jgi:hypothetical protein
VLPTKHKIAIARAVNRVIVAARAIIGRSSRVAVRRRNVKWELDLNEGIDLALYLGVYQRIPKRAFQWIPPGWLVIDVGANIGAHALPLAHDVDGHVIAVEPTDYGFSRLKANVALNPRLHPRLILVQAALTAGAESADRDENIQFYARWPLRGGGPDPHGKHLGKTGNRNECAFPEP